MKLCQTCGQMLAEEITGCPSCGSEVAEGRKTIDDYRILEVLHEGKPDLAAYANQNAGSVAFVLVEYWLESDEKIYYRNRTEGTAFLADPEGYLLTNRHVACPWLEDGRLFAVLKIDPVPMQLRPLPLDHGMDPLKIPKFLPVITLGFPLGSRTKETTINVIVTRGHVRRAFEKFLQVDTSLYRGNSGGPLIDIHGKVIGIASGI